MKMRQPVQKLPWMKSLLLICSLVLSFNFPTVEYICFILTPVLCVHIIIIIIIIIITTTTTTTTTLTADDDDDNDDNR